MKLLNMSGTQLTGGKNGALCAILTDRIPRVPAESKKFYLHMKAEDFKPTQIMDWFARAEDELKLLHQAVIKVESYAVQVGTKPVHDMSKLRIPKREPREEPRHKKDHHDRKEKRKSGQDSRTCKVCGREHHSPSNCQLNVPGHRHPEGNQSEQDWCDSAMGKAWEAKGFKTLPFNETLSGAAWQPPSKGSNDKKSFVKKQKKCKEQLHSLILHDSTQDLVSCKIKFPNNCNATSTILLDTGALHGNYISHEVAEKIIENDKTKCKEKKRSVQGAFTTSHECSNVECNVCVNVTNEENCEQTFCFDAAVINTSQEIILGRQAIKENALVGAFPSQFMNMSESNDHYDDTYLGSSTVGRTPCKRPKTILQSKVEKEGGESGRENKKRHNKRQQTSCKQIQKEEGNSFLLSQNNEADMQTEASQSLQQQICAINEIQLHALTIKRSNLKQIRESYGNFPEISFY
jgi:hypothetical protein